MSGVGNVVSDSKTHLFTRVNEKFCEITGYSAEELATKTAEDITHPDDRDRDAEGWARFLDSSDEHFHIEKRYLRKDGGTVWVSVTSTIIRDDEGRPLRSIGVVSDITDRQSAVKALDQTRNDLERHVSKRTCELEAANQHTGDSRGRFSAGDCRRGRQGRRHDLERSRRAAVRRGGAGSFSASRCSSSRPPMS